MPAAHTSPLQSPSQCENASRGSLPCPAKSFPLAAGLVPFPAPTSCSCFPPPAGAHCNSRLGRGVQGLRLEFVSLADFLSWLLESWSDGSAVLWGVWEQEGGRNRRGVFQGEGRKNRGQTTGVEVFGYKSAFPRDPPHPIKPRLIGPAPSSPTSCWF